MQLLAAPNGGSGKIFIEARSEHDIMRIKIGRLGEIPILDLDSVAPTNSTTVQAANPSTVHLHQDEADLFDPGIYSIEAAIVDTSDGNSIRHADQGVFQLLPTQLGELAAT